VTLSTDAGPNHNW